MSGWVAKGGVGCGWDWAGVRDAVPLFVSALYTPLFLFLPMHLALSGIGIGIARVGAMIDNVSLQHVLRVHCSYGARRKDLHFTLVSPFLLAFFFSADGHRSAASSVSPPFPARLPPCLLLVVLVFLLC